MELVRDELQKREELVKKKEHLIREKNDLEIMKKTTELGSEYMTLQKLLSFLHAALLMTGHLISYGDLTRYKKIFVLIIFYINVCMFLKVGS